VSKNDKLSLSRHHHKSCSKSHVKERLNRKALRRPRKTVTEVTLSMLDIDSLHKFISQLTAIVYSPNGYTFRFCSKTKP